MANIKGAIDKFNEISTKSGDSAQLLEKRRLELKSKIRDIRNSATFAGLTNITEKTGYSDSIVFEVVGIKDVTIRIFKHWNLAAYKSGKADIDGEFGISFGRESFGSYNEPTSIFRSDVNSKVNADASKLGSSVEKMLDENIKICQLLKALRTDVFSPKGKLYAKVKEWADIELEMQNEPIEDVKSVQAAKQEIELAKAAVFEEFRNSVIEALSKGIKSKAKSKEALFANITKNRKVLEKCGVKVSNYIYNEESFVREAIGYSYPRTITKENLYPLFWDKTTNSPVEADVFKLVKQNAKSVGISIDEVKKSEMSTERLNSQYKFDTKFITEYSSRNGNVYIRQEVTGAKGIKSATSFERLFVLALAFNPELFTKEIYDFAESQK